MKKILFVDSGNICRSPMAVCIFKQILKDRGIKNEFVISSCGINAQNNLPMNDSAIKVLKEFKIKVEEHSSKRIEESDILNSDLVLTMTNEQKEFLGAFENVNSLSNFTKSEDILDPYGEDFEFYKNVCQKLICELNILVDILEK